MGPRQMAGFRVPRRAVRTGLGELGSPRRAAAVAGRHQALGAMEPPAHPADPTDAADPGDSAEARAKQPGKGKWALVRSLNQALKTYAVLPVSPGPGWGGGTRLLEAGRATGSQNPRMRTDSYPQTLPCPKCTWPARFPSEPELLQLENRRCPEGDSLPLPWSRAGCLWCVTLAV